jgi:hypothetical protein
MQRRVALMFSCNTEMVVGRGKFKSAVPKYSSTYSKKKGATSFYSNKCHSASKLVHIHCITYTQC